MDVVVPENGWLPTTPCTFRALCQRWRARKLVLAIGGSVIGLGSFGFAATYDEIEALPVVMLSAEDAEQFRATLVRLPMPGQESTLDGPAAEHMWRLAVRLAPPEVG